MLGNHQESLFNPTTNSKLKRRLKIIWLKIIYHIDVTKIVDSKRRVDLDAFEASFKE